ncbi:MULTISPECIES: trigger factor [Salinivibrio]|uniref:Trigger factor n=1 Tax=Salinivibrio kushneri TaxID=1908198 RepID=A0AB36KAA0_9GAMM|nr:MULTISPECIES: trigger factor [Salinivibrio]ODP97719.1 trigger factor [Salinivibrio sp. BNH]OOE35087.1 trigger factor [Salinivibrio kushneri]OOE36863.1 trigger factor [Salinivibrio kushneri]OOE38799.1 trigger factor [Salinivibrio kushneri]OOE44908.1 trigger factor [Salinivibrio kushneri]
MQVTVETTEGLKRQMTITVPAANIDDAVTKELRNIAKNRRFDGFRKGKVPLKMVSRMYGDTVRQDVLGEVMQRHFIEAMIQEKVNPAGAPSFTPVENEAGQDLVFKADFEVYPEVELQGLDAISVEKPKAEVQESDVDEMLDTLRKQQASWVEADGEAKENSRVTLDFVGTIDGEEFEGGKAEGFQLEMGQGRMIPGFEDGLVGKKAGEEFTIDVNFPDDYHAENLKGKAAQFAIKLHTVEEQELPELTEEFVQRFGIADGSVEGLKAEVRKNMDRELKQAIKNKVKEQVLDGLVEQNQIDVPSALIEQEIGTLRQQAAQRFGGNMDSASQLPRELFEEQAKRRVSVGLLLGEVIKSEELEADDERVKALIEEMASAYEDPSEVVAYYEKDEKLMENMRNVALEEQAIDALLAKATVTEAEVGFSDLMNASQQA